MGLANRGLSTEEQQPERPSETREAWKQLSPQDRWRLDLVRGVLQYAAGETVGLTQRRNPQLRTTSEKFWPSGGGVRGGKIMSART